MDRLPVEVIHRILSFFPYTADAVHTSVLSKTWLQVWSTNPRLNFCQRQFRKKLTGKEYVYDTEVEELVREKFVKFVDTTLQRQRQQSPGIVKFKLSISIDAIKLADKWLGIAVGMAVRHISIHLRSVFGTPPFYRLPQSIVDSSSLTSLKVRGPAVINFCFGDYLGKKCCSLKKLHLEGVWVGQSTIHRLSSVFPFIEDLKLIQRRSLRIIAIANLPNLKKFHVCSNSFPNIKISQPHCLESFTYKASHDNWYMLTQSQYFDIFPCQHLTYMKLSLCMITDIYFHKLLSQCPVLEDLVLVGCDKLRRVNVSSHSLKYLKISRGWRLDVKIDAPNLTKLDYDNWVVPSFSSTTLFHGLEATVLIS